MSADKVSWNMADEIEHYKESPLVQKALEDLEAGMQAKNRNRQISQDVGEASGEKDGQKKLYVASEITEMKLTRSMQKPKAKAQKRRQPRM